MSTHSSGHLHARRFPYYAVGLYVGLVVALVVGDLLARRSGVDPVRLVAAFLITIPFCLAGSRVLEVALDVAHYRAHPREILRLSRGGAAMYGGLPPALLVSIPLASWIGMPFGAFWDVALVAVVAGMIPTRLGCLGAGCCAGRPTTRWFGLVLRDAHGVRARRLPSPLFEAALGATLLMLSITFWDRLAFPGAVALFVTAGYGAGRFVLEGLREQRAPRYAGLGAYQWMSAGLCALGVVGLAWGFGGGRALELVETARASDTSSVLHLVVSGFLLLPVVYLFRFLGCDVVFSLDRPPGIRHSLQMIVIVPDIGTGSASVRMEFVLEPEMTEIDESPVTLAPVATQPDGRLSFEAVKDLPEGSYTVTCTVSRTGALTRSGMCSGDLNGPGLIVAFNAENASAPNVLQPRLCFQTL